MEFIFEVIDKVTGKPANPEQVALREEWARHLHYSDMEGFSIGESGDLILSDEWGNTAYCPKGRFEIRWNGDPRKRTGLTNVRNEYKTSSLARLLARL